MSNNQNLPLKVKLFLREQQFYLIGDYTFTETKVDPRKSAYTGSLIPSGIVEYLITTNEGTILIECTNNFKTMRIVSSDLT